MFWNKKSRAGRKLKTEAAGDEKKAPVSEVFKSGDLRPVKATAPKYRVAAVKAKRKAQRRSRRCARLAAA